jgi:hypothetical protein
MIAQCSRLQAASACVTLAFASHSKDIVYSDTRGVLNEDVYFTCVELAAKACTKIHNFYRLSIEKRLQKGI